MKVIMIVLMLTNGQPPEVSATVVNEEVCAMLKDTMETVRTKIHCEELTEL